MNYIQALPSDLPAHDLYRQITNVFGKLNIEKDPWLTCVQETITQVLNLSSGTRWCFILYVSDDPLFEKQYELAIHEQRNNWFIDKYGNFFNSEEEFLWNLPFARYHTSKSSLRKSVHMNPNMLNCLKIGFHTMFQEDGVTLLLKFIDFFEYEAEDKLKELRVIYPFFGVLMKLPKVKRDSLTFSVNQSHLVVHIHGNSKKLNLAQLRRENKFRFFKNIFVSETDDDVPLAFSNLCQSMLDEMRNKRKILMWKDEQLKRYKDDINKIFSGRSKFSYYFHQIATALIKLLPERISLSEFKYIVSWVQYKCSIILENEAAFDSIMNNSNKIEQYSNELHTLLKNVRDCRKSLHSFAHDYSSMYHTNRHFDELNNFFKKCPPGSQLINLAKMCSEFKNISLTPSIDIRTIDKNMLQKCVQFYLKDIPDFVFNEMRYINGSIGFKKETGEKCQTYQCTKYTAGYFILGIKAKIGEKEFVVTIHKK